MRSAAGQLPRRSAVAEPRLEIELVPALHRPMSWNTRKIYGEIRLAIGIRKVGTRRRSKARAEAE